MTAKNRIVGRVLVVLMSAVLMASGCTVHQTEHYQVDFVPGPGYHVHLYRNPTMMIWFTHSVFCGWDPGCTLGKVREQADVNGIFNTISGVDLFFDDDAADFDEALRSTPHPWPLSVNLPAQYGCLGGYKNLLVPHADGDWYGDPPDKPWCPIGKPLT